MFQAWDALTGQELFSISPHSDATRSLSISEDNLMFASGCDNGTIEVSLLLFYFIKITLASPSDLVLFLL